MYLTYCGALPAGGHLADLAPPLLLVHTSAASRSNPPPLPALEAIADQPHKVAWIVEGVGVGGVRARHQISRISNFRT